MSRTSKILASLSILSLSLSGWAATLNLSGQCFDHTFSYYEYDFRVVSDLFSKLPENSKVHMISSFDGNGSVDQTGSQGVPFTNYHPQVDDLIHDESQPAGTLSGQRKIIYMATGGYLSHLDFRFEIETPRGETIYVPELQRDEHGKLVQPYYQAEFFRMNERECYELRERMNLAYTLRVPAKNP